MDTEMALVSRKIGFHVAKQKYHPRKIFCAFFGIKMLRVCQSKTIYLPNRANISIKVLFFKFLNAINAHLEEYSGTQFKHFRKESPCEGEVWSFGQKSVGGVN